MSTNAENVISDIQAERRKQDAKWGEQNHTDVVWSAILGEEVGEVAKEVLNQLFYGNDRVYEELIQVAAVAVAWAECIHRSHHLENA